MGLLGFDKLNVIKTPDDTNKSKGSGVSGGTIDLTDEILDATEEYEKAWQDAFDKMESKAQAFADIIETGVFNSWLALEKNCCCVSKEVRSGFSAHHESFITTKNNIP